MLPFRIGVIGCGKISDVYIQNCQRFDGLEIVACASLDIAESQAKASQHGIAKACSVDEILKDPDVDCALNLTIPAAHADISRRALLAGKHVYSEKPLAAGFKEALELAELADQQRLLVGCAPDTILGNRVQTVRKLLDEGLIGEVTGVMAAVGTHGVERHHPNPDFYYQQGGGPLLDLGPYYLASLITWLGPIARVGGMGRKTFDRREIENGPRQGEFVPVEVDTHELSLLEFESGVIGTMTMSFDVWDSEMPRLEIYGTDGTICLPDPDPVHGTNQFGGQVWFRRRKDSRWAFQPRPVGREGWRVAENLEGYDYNARGLGLLDLAGAVRNSRKPRASAQLALHVCDVIHQIHRSAETGQFQHTSTSCARPEPLYSKQLD